MNRRKSFFHSRFYNSSAITILLILLFLFSTMIDPLEILMLPSLLFIAAHRIHVSSNKKLRIEYLRQDIQKVDLDLKQLDFFRDKGDIQAYQELAGPTLERLETIQAEAIDLRKKLGLKRYNTISKTATKNQQKVNYQLQEYKQLDYQEQLRLKEAYVEPIDDNQWEGPIPEEIRETYLNIQKDHQEIIRKIENSTGGNQQELMAVHQSQMKNFQEILNGYLKIYQDPKDYYQAQQRLKKAQVAMEQFDLLLDETLKQLNETDMRDFEISLRILSPENETGEHK
ncbi:MULTISPECIES: hypothetical protein [unclassified Streptococcus]|uniref:hypothetical protein n=1 Tax=unclassified Streptococcus TaxID=2608887 RepID=UPI0018A9860C|nr:MULTISPECIES: hypothetical protein [unclassified Streptococcus]MBF8970252.1 hypothetical protein [Streptococcus sp. NLN76]MBG9366856.1 hypothetical protein [Streptococcus sp. NLN64]